MTPLLAHELQSTFSLAHTWQESKQIYGISCIDAGYFIDSWYERVGV